MNELENRINDIDIKIIKDYLNSLNTPCYESKLYKLIFKTDEIFKTDSLTLYKNHFLLFHILYKLQNEYYSENKYLHIHFMRISLSDYPKTGLCRFYNDELGRFCSAIANNNEYCDFHLKKIGETNLENLSTKYFYLDKKNYYKLNKKTAEDLINGTWEVLSKYSIYKESFKILDLPESADINTIKKRFKFLAKKYHPDKNNDTEKKFTEINNAYRFILKMLSLKKL